MCRVRTFVCLLALVGLLAVQGLGGVALAASKGVFKDEPLIKERRWKEAEEFYARKLVEFAEAKGTKSEQDLLRLALCRDVGRYFGQMEGEDATSLTDWLLDEPNFISVLLAAFGPEDSPPQAFHILAELKKKFGERKILAFPGLAIAHAVVWDGKTPVSKKFTAADSFGYYVSSARGLAFDLTSLPYEAALFLACAEAAPEERVWARRGYNPPKSLSAIYHLPDYDMAFLMGKAKRIDRHEYNLPNLLKYGGICGDRAYFAANVARACGIPAARISGIGERGAHAWVGYISSFPKAAGDAHRYSDGTQPGGGNRCVWNLNCGRYSYDRYYTGVTRDPQSGKEMNDYELGMRTLGCSLPADRQMAAYAYVFLAEVLEKRENSAPVKWALEQAIKSNRFNLAAWEQAMRLCKSGVFDAAYADRLMDDALKVFPDELDFCFGVFTAMMATIPKEQLARQKRLYQQAAGFFKARPDLTVGVAGGYGDYLLEVGKKREAYEVYNAAIRAHTDDPRLVVDLAIKVTQKRQEGDEPKKAVALLTSLIRYTARPPLGDPFAKDSEWYRLRKCLQGVYQEMGEQKAAAAIEAELAKYKME